ncbi:MAG: TonB-dependent receptor, partial [Xanthomonadales bacterium]|nr:TonB-dependent receptor [Xanthomonadales bacterium]
MHDVRLGGSEQLLAGVQLQREKGSSVDTFGQVNQYAEQLDHAAVFTALQGRHGAFDHELALRYDDHERFGGELSSQLAVGWRFDPGRLYLSFGEGFRAPNLNELYSPGFGGLFAGNPNLGPESSRSLELGLDTDLAGTALALNIYRTRVNDLIAFEGGQSFQAVNIAEAAVDGAELTLSRRFE